MQYFMTQWYVFQSLTKNSQIHIQENLRNIGKNHDMNGLILVAPEGCNGTVAGSQEAIAAIKAYLTEQFGDIFFQNWKSDIKPFRRFKVDLRNEIVALKKPVAFSPPYEGGAGGGSSRTLTSPNPSFVRRGNDHLSPTDFHAMIERKDVVVLDTRNWYETNIGSFKDAIIPDIKSFQEFPTFVEKSSIPKDKPVVMYCTSGIRCEKAAEEMRSQGYQEVYQLDGGITNYLQEYPEGHWNGECFVFDHRSAIDSKLQPSKRYSLCRSCGNPGDVRTHCANCATPSIMCETCLQKSPAICSKACKRALEKLPI